jgi:hypothetical protein
VRRTAAAGLLACTLAYAQVPREVPPPPAETQPAAAPASQPPIAVEAAAPAGTASGEAAGAGQPPPAAQRAAPKTPPRAAAPAREESPREADVAALRQEVSRLQSELDAERAAALPSPEEAATGLQPAYGAWGWLVATALLALAAGFLLGWRLLDRRIRRRYGGLRIY